MAPANDPWATHERQPFVGREGELNALNSLLDQAAVGEGAFVLISGEAGVGKTRLAMEAAAAAGRRNFRVFTGACRESEGAPPYAPFVDILESAIRAVPRGDISAVLGDAAPEVAKLVPHLRQLLPEIPDPLALAPEQERHFLFNRVCEFLVRLAEQDPLLLVVEDLQWADDPSCYLFQHLTRRLEAVPIILVGAYRDSEVVPDLPFSRVLEDVVRSRLGRRLALNRLTLGEAEEMLRSLTGETPPSAVTEALYRETDGNPFFLEEVLMHFNEEGRLFGPDGGWRAELIVTDRDVPESVRLVLGRRLARLRQGTQDLLATAAVIGRVFELRILEAQPAENDKDLLDAVEEAQLARIILPAGKDPGDAFMFSHELVRQVLLASLGTARRQRLHREIADAIKQVHGDGTSRHVVQLAHHLYRAGSGSDWQTTAHYLHAAGQLAMASAAYEEAGAYYQRALDLRPPDERDSREHCELLLDLATALWSAGDLQRAGEQFSVAADLAKKLQAEELVARAVLGVGQGWGWVPTERLVILLTDALNALEGRDDAARARIMARLAVELQSVPGDTRAQREDLSTQAVALARRAGDNETLAYALVSWGSVFREFANVEERLAAAEEALSLADSWDLISAARQDRELALLQLGRIREADADHETLVGLARERGEPFSLWEVFRYDTMRALLDGRFKDAEAIAQEQLGLDPQMGRFPGRVEVFSVQTLMLRWQRGELAALEAPTRQGLERYPSDRPVWRATLALICCENGKWADARAEFDELASESFQEVSHHRNWVLATSLLVEACALLGDAAHAVELYGLLLPLKGQHITARNNAYLGPAARYLGVLARTMGRMADAADHFESAMEMSAAIGARPALAQAQYDYAKLLLERRGPGDRVRGRALLEEALGTAEVLGMKRLEERARKLLGAPGTPVHPAGLSLREVEVLRLLAEGKSSREVGAELVLTVRTVERHITNIYRKIGAHNRAQATAFALEHGLTRRA
jgi:DNA-binding CsgD family transcriptional regulator/tetratricopeptide (TPR) repeat protein